MGTRGFITFVADKVEKTTYNHCDSYPSGLGMDVLRWARYVADDLEDARRRAIALRVVGNSDKPTDEDIERLGPHADLGVSTQRLDDWYVLLRRTQGDPQAILDAGVIIDSSDFPIDSLFAEYGYVVDLDAEVFEVYEGFQRTAHDKGRFAARGDQGAAYYPVALVKSWSFKELPSDEEFAAAFASDDE